MSGQKKKILRVTVPCICATISTISHPSTNPIHNIARKNEHVTKSQLSVQLPRLEPEEIDRNIFASASSAVVNPKVESNQNLADKDKYEIKNPSICLPRLQHPHPLLPSIKIVNSNLNPADKAKMKEKNNKLAIKLIRGRINFSKEKKKERLQHILKPSLKFVNSNLQSADKAKLKKKSNKLTPKTIFERINFPKGEKKQRLQHPLLPSTKIVNSDLESANKAKVKKKSNKLAPNLICERINFSKDEKKQRVKDRYPKKKFDQLVLKSKNEDVKFQSNTTQQSRLLKKVNAANIEIFKLQTSTLPSKFDATAEHKTPTIKPHQPSLRIIYSQLVKKLIHNISTSPNIKIEQKTNSPVRDTQVKPLSIKLEKVEEFEKAVSSMKNKTNLKNEQNFKLASNFEPSNPTVTVRVPDYVKSQEYFCHKIGLGKRQNSENSVALPSASVVSPKRLRSHYGSNDKSSFQADFVTKMESNNDRISSSYKKAAFYPKSVFKKDSQVCVEGTKFITARSNLKKLNCNYCDQELCFAYGFRKHIQIHIYLTDVSQTIQGCSKKKVAERLSNNNELGKNGRKKVGLKKLLKVKKTKRSPLALINKRLRLNKKLKNKLKNAIEISSLEHAPKKQLQADKKGLHTAAKNSPIKIENCHHCDPALCSKHGLRKHIRICVNLDADGASNTAETVLSPLFLPREMYDGKQIPVEEDERTLAPGTSVTDKSENLSECNFKIVEIISETSSVEKMVLKQTSYLEPEILIMSTNCQFNYKKNKVSILQDFIAKQQSSSLQEYRRRMQFRIFDKSLNRLDKNNGILKFLFPAHNLMDSTSYNTYEQTLIQNFQNSIPELLTKCAINNNSSNLKFLPTLQMLIQPFKYTSSHLFPSMESTETIFESTTVKPETVLEDVEKKQKQAYKVATKKCSMLNKDQFYYSIKTSLLFQNYVVEQRNSNLTDYRHRRVFSQSYKVDRIVNIMSSEVNLKIPSLYSIHEQNLVQNFQNIVQSTSSVNSLRNFNVVNSLPSLQVFGQTGRNELEENKCYNTEEYNTCNSESKLDASMDLANFENLCHRTSSKNEKSEMRKNVNNSRRSVSKSRVKYWLRNVNPQPHQVSKSCPLMCCNATHTKRAYQGLKNKTLNDGVTKSNKHCTFNPDCNIPTYKYNLRSYSESKILNNDLAPVNESSASYSNTHPVNPSIKSSVKFDKYAQQSCLQLNDKKSKKLKRKIPYSRNASVTETNSNSEISTTDVISREPYHLRSRNKSQLAEYDAGNTDFWTNLLEDVESFVNCTSSMKNENSCSIIEDVEMVNSEEPYLMKLPLVEFVDAVPKEFNYSYARPAPLEISSNINLLSLDKYELHQETKCIDEVTSLEIRKTICSVERNQHYEFSRINFDSVPQSLTSFSPSNVKLDPTSVNTNVSDLVEKMKRLRIIGIDNCFLCDLCGNSFLSKKKLILHLKLKCCIYKCQCCKEIFYNKEKFEIHLRSHAREYFLQSFFNISAFK